VSQSSTHFKDLVIGERGLMLILSTSSPITVENIIGEMGAVLITGVVLMAFPKMILETFEVQYDPGHLCGVFKSIHK
jgi:hypothetical protein